jgi:hypothetical protein
MTPHDLLTKTARERTGLGRDLALSRRSREYGTAPACMPPRCAEPNGRDRSRHFEGLPIVKPAVAIDQTIDDRVPSHPVRQAINIARQRNLITKTEQDRRSRKTGKRS